MILKNEELILQEKKLQLQSKIVLKNAFFGKF